MSDISASAIAKEMDKPGAIDEESKGKRRGSTDDPSLNMDELRELAALVDEHGYTDFEFENANIRVRLSRMPAPQAYQPMYAPQPMAVNAPQSAASVPAASAEPAAAAEEELFNITSPIVGTFYRAPGPDKDPYVAEGSKVTENSIVCIVEAMKLMNEIEAEVSGEVVKIYVENGQPVEYGQPLFGIRK